MRQVEFCERVRLGEVTYQEGDRVTLDDLFADRCIARGWAKDPVTGEQGERVPGAHPVTVNNVSQEIS